MSPRDDMPAPRPVDPLRAARRRQLRGLALGLPVFLAGTALSLWLLGRPSLAAVVLWIALFVALLAYVLHQELPK